MDLQLGEKVALVTGSSKGIGAALATALANEGACVIVHGRSAAEADTVADAITAAGARAHVVTGDLTIDGDVAALTAKAKALAGRVDILINNAGGSGAGEDWGNAAAVNWASTFDRNVLAAVRVTSAILPHMRAAKWGRIINISSLAG